MKEASAKNNRWLSGIIKLGTLTIGFFVLCNLSFQLAVWFWPYPTELKKPPSSSTWIEDRNGRPLAAFVSSESQWHFPLKAEEMSPHLLNAIVAVEDSRFYRHAGVDWLSVSAACWQDLIAMDIVRGASTITMQVEHLRSCRPRTWTAKLLEAVRAYQLENKMSKREILVEYLNRCPFGGNLTGAGAASWRYFDRPCRELSLSQAAVLAGLPQSPNRYRPDRHPERALIRRNHVLHRMLDNKMITVDEYSTAMAEPLDAAWRPLPQDHTSSALPGDGALPALLQLELHYPGQKIRSTLDESIQQQAARCLEEQLMRLKSSGITAGSIVILNTQNAEVLSSASLSLDEANDIDFTRSLRSTGSLLKPFIYAAAFEMGIARPSSILTDSPQAWSGYAPMNYDRIFMGPLTAAEALAQSRNIPAMNLLSKVGISRAVGIMNSAGLHSLAYRKEPFGLTLAIGGAEATPLEIAQAYATLGRGGNYLSANFIYAFESETKDNISSIHKSILTSWACTQVLESLSGKERTEKICPEAVKKHVAWKTGTSSGHKDAWCAAVTPRMTIVVWLGNPAGIGSQNLVGRETAAPLALRLMANLDPGGDAWPVLDSRKILPEIMFPKINAPSGLTITTLTPEEKLFLDPNESKSTQKVPLQSSGGTPNSPRWWFMDGQILGKSDGNEPLWWSPSKGAHEIRVMDEEGRSAAARVQIR